MSDKILYLESEDFTETVENYSGLVLVDFYADWCGPCKMLGPVIEEIAEEFSDKIRVCKVNTDNAQEIAVKYSISGIPAVLLFKSGQVLENVVGFRPKENYIDLINKHLS